MSHEAVRAFYSDLAADPARANRYEQLTRTWWAGYRPKKIVALAGAVGHHFTAEELEYVRLTNAPNGHGMGSRRHEIEDEPDYQPTAFPHPPASQARFRSLHGRPVG